ncbi:hypothetical protein NDU88_001013 [Pleurodeles waltl]|uniref:Uncharacterized protein n=1 Tax=Pleurodeles waltl TaxID=8319 RepID=A0AAV7MMH5_PLEWA|nr:hypothetical protein NDU88_001013 [Pleurodeles waltl]
MPQSVGEWQGMAGPQVRAATDAFTSLLPTPAPWSTHQRKPGTRRSSSEEKRVARLEMTFHRMRPISYPRSPWRRARQTD